MAETLVAALIIAGMMAVTFQTIASAAAASRLIGQRSAAMLVAQSALARADSEGRFDQAGNSGRSGDYVWHVGVFRYGNARSDNQYSLRQLRVDVRDVRTGRPLATLKTLRLAR